MVRDALLTMRRNYAAAVGEEEETLGNDIVTTVDHPGRCAWLHANSRGKRSAPIYG
jgi:hypothetical protein